MALNLKSWADSKSPFLRLEDGEKCSVIFLKAEEVPDNFNTDSTKIRYHLQTEEGDVKFFESGSASMARAFSEVKEGESVSISRDGVGSKTKYEVVKA